MKKLYLLTLVFCLSVGAFAQNCSFNYTMAGAAGVFSFTPHPSLSNNIYHFEWDFGDGNVSNLYNPIHTYNSSAPYIVCLTVYDSLNFVYCTHCDTLSTHAINCNFTAAIQGLTVVFTGQPSSAHSDLYWDFGTGGPQHLGNPVTNVYANDGTYSVCMLEIDPNTGDTLCTSCHQITVTSSTTGNCSFTAQLNPNSVLTYDFVANAFATANVSWDFGDGSTGTGNTTTHTFPGPGTYNVCFTALTSSGNTCNYCHVVTVGNSHGNCFFTFVPDTTQQNGFLFTGSPAWPGSTIDWDFGDGTTGSGVQASHAFAAAGTYTVCMTERDSTSSIICTTCSQVTVGGSSTCSFTSSINPFHNLTLNFLANSAPGSVVAWDFGDGSTGTGTSVSHTYSQPGTYQVCISIGSAGSVSCTYCNSVTIGNSTGTCQISYVFDPFITGGVQFNIQPSTLTSTIVWDFGDNTTGTGASVNHVYQHSGAYTVCVTEYDSQQQILCTSCISIHVGGNNTNCQAGFIGTSLGLDAYFVDLSLVNSNATTYSWDFGDGGTSSIRFPQHSYNHPGTYNVCLTVTSNNCTDTYCSPIVIDTTGNPGGTTCRALFAIVQLAPYQVTVVNLSSGLNLNFLWDFDDGSTSTQPFPSHVYAATGSYNLCLTVSDNNGCTSTYCDTLSVDSLGNIFRLSMQGFTVNVVSPAQLTGVNEIVKQRTFNVFPNPFSSELTIQCNTGFAAAKEYRILSIEGAEVMIGKLNGFEGKVNASSLSRGAYLIELTLTDGSRSYQNIIKN